jgi:hypothetical protein
MTDLGRIQSVCYQVDNLAPSDQGPHLLFFTLTLAYILCYAFCYYHLPHSH